MQRPRRTRPSHIDEDEHESSRVLVSDAGATVSAMRVDLDGAVRVARLAASFRWTWTFADLESFCAVAGWRVAESWALETTLTTDLDVDSPRADASTFLGLRRWRRGRSVMNSLTVWVSDISSEPDADAQVNAGLTALTERLTTEIGAPDSPDDYSATAARWDLPDVRIRLVRRAPYRFPEVQTGAVAMHLSKPVKLALIDTVLSDSDQDQADEDDWEVSADPPQDWSELASRLAGVFADMPSDAYLTLRTPDSRYAQFVGGPDDFYCEVVSNRSLAPEQRIPPDLEALLAVRGWSEPPDNGTENWAKDLNFPVTRLTCTRLADDVVHALSVVLGVIAPSELEVWAWRDGLEQRFGVAALGLRFAPRP